MSTDLQRDVNAILGAYSAEVTAAASDVIGQVAKEAAKKLRQTSPKRTGEYARGWTYKVEKGRISTSAEVYGKRQTYPIAHLLEFGHAKRNGGRVEGIEHIKPVEEWAVKEAEDRIISRIT